MSWSQYPNLSRLPSLTLADKTLSISVLKSHFAKVTSEYGPTIVVSLTDHKGREAGITEQFAELAAQAPNVRFQYFDFHTECARMHWENIDKLIAKIQDGIDSISYTKVTSDRLEKEQTGVVRTNCIDCLDRTNVLQSVIAKQVLEKQLKELGINAIDCDAQFRNIWADNADVISIQYAGTPALKTDYTRTGKRTIAGSLADGQNAVVRYYVNTCQDGTRQDAYDAVTQSVKCEGYAKGNNLLLVLFFALLALIAFLIGIVTKGKKVAKEEYSKAKRQSVNRPHFRDSEINKT
jgi:hypothetical protein